MILRLEVEHNDQEYFIDFDFEGDAAKKLIEAENKGTKLTGNEIGAIITAEYPEFVVPDTAYRLSKVAMGVLQ